MENLESTLMAVIFIITTVLAIIFEGGFSWSIPLDKLLTKLMMCRQIKFPSSFSSIRTSYLMEALCDQSKQQLDVLWKYYWKLGLTDLSEICANTKNQFDNVRASYKKINSLKKQFTNEDLTLLCVLLNKLFLLSQSVTTLKESMDVFDGIEDSPTAQETAEGYKPSLQTIYRETIKINKELNVFFNVLAQRICAPITPPTTNNAEKTAFDQVLAAESKCKSGIVTEKMVDLAFKMQLFLDNADKDPELAERLNTYYLPTLTILLQDLSAAERKKSKTVPTRETLCLQTIETISKVLQNYNEDAEHEDLMKSEVEVETLKNIATIKGDLSSPELDISTFKEGALS